MSMKIKEILNESFFRTSSKNLDRIEPSIETPAPAVFRNPRGAKTDVEQTKNWGHAADILGDYLNSPLPDIDPYEEAIEDLVLYNGWTSELARKAINSLRKGKA